MPRHHPDLAQELLAHQVFLQRLARGLVGGDADDLVQDVWQRALERPPLHRGQLRAWLARVTRNLAANRHRANARRAAREEYVAREASSRDVLNRRFELRQELVRALDSLAEPYRGTLLLRYFEDLPPGKIAGRQGVPVATVKATALQGE